MKKTVTLLLLALFLVLSFGCGNGDIPDEDDKETITETKLVTYDGPSLLTSSKKAKVTVNKEELFVYETRVNSGRVFTFSSANISTVPLAIFDFEGKVTVSVEIIGVTITTAKVTPAGYGINPTVNGSTITFDLEYPTAYTVEYNNQTKDVVHLFANPIEENTPDPSNLPENMIYIGPGVYKADAIPVTSNSEVYIAGGAVVYGQIRAGSVKNVTIRGRGIISGEIYPRTKASEFTIPFEIRNSESVTLEGLTFLDPAGWAINAYFVKGLTVDNIKVVTARANGDGISIQSCQDVVVKRSFVRSWDDSLVVKNYDRGSTDNIRFENITIWTDLAQSMEIGYEAYGEKITKVVFDNITVLHNFHKPAISIHNADDADISEISFTDITIEDAQMGGDNPSDSYDNFLIHFEILYNLEWTSSGQERGTISNVTVDNLLVLEGRDDLNTKIYGYDSTHEISDVELNNITIKGKPIKKAADLNLAELHTDNVDIDFSEESTGATPYTYYKLALETDQVQYEKRPNIEQVGLIVPEFSKKEIADSYMGVEVRGEFAISSTRGTSTTVWDDGSGANEITGHTPDAIFDNDANTFWQAKPWENTSGEYAALTITFDTPKTIGTIRLFGNPDSEIYLTQNIAIYGVKSSSTSDRYLKVTNSDNYEFSPADGNFADIKINPDTFKSLQIRIYHEEGLAMPNDAYLHEVRFYPASLSFGKSVTGSVHEDVYVITNLVDGIPNTYYESKKGIFPAEITIDLADIYDIKYINLHLPPLMQWEKRTQVISFYVSNDGVNYTKILDSRECIFDPLTGNVVEIILDSVAAGRYLKFVVHSNTASGGEAAQLSEVSVYE